ncbi:hypothetical protein BO71DRAFT_436300 [Aspergillus ellipticus CBS 707.79]|uniref:Flavin-containing monooxygenase n=1 Tax=Aspergillus ellipticus CBS 707.79 TaxID=1448320 RepID=A0A319E9V1_9EURO|nr:hypothetical protein BO71DRAFT_436300 [Aspergillus ellipticus CBS 707.79]
MASTVLPTLPCFLPKSNLPDGIDVAAVAREFATLGALGSDDVTSDAVWRDSVALTGTFRTFYSGAVAVAWTERCLARQAHAFQLNPGAARVVRPAAGLGWIEVPFTFETKAAPTATCSGWVSLVPENGWKVWLLRTILEGFIDHPNVDDPQPLPITKDSADYECVVIGCGQSGLSVAGRLQALGVSYLVVDKVPQVGESWLQRYESMKLHTPRESSHLPFGRTFTDEYPEFLSRQDLAQGYRATLLLHWVNLRILGCQQTQMDSASASRPNPQAHDVAKDMVETGLQSVTMIQRSQTCIIPVEYMPKRASAQIERNPERFDALERTGFRVDRSGDVFAHVHERYGGHYLDVGNCDNIVNGLVSLLFDDDTHLHADVVVFATGFKQNVRDTVRTLFGEDVYNGVDDSWGLDKEGELRGAFRPSLHSNIWFLSGTSGHSRYFSRFIALLVKADLDGQGGPAYRENPVALNCRGKYSLCSEGSGV